jgi:hypothetical protein
MRTTQLFIDGQTYNLKNLKRVSLPTDVPRLIIVSYQPNETAQNILRVCIQTIQKFTSSPYELWVVDNNSPNRFVQWLQDLPDVNVVLNRTEPVSTENKKFKNRILGAIKRIWGDRVHQIALKETIPAVIAVLSSQYQQVSGSYANAIGLEIGIRLIDQNVKYILPLHMDTMACHPNWLAYLQSKITSTCKAAGVRMDYHPERTPEGVLHILGILIDYQFFREKNLDFFPRWPRYDVGDFITTAIRNSGFDVFSCENSVWEPYKIGDLPESSPYRDLFVNHAFNDDGEVIFLHLSRGVRRSAGKQIKMHHTTASEWIDFADRLLLVDK